MSIASSGGHVKSLEALRARARALSLSLSLSLSPSSLSLSLPPRLPLSSPLQYLDEVLQAILHGAPHADLRRRRRRSEGATLLCSAHVNERSWTDCFVLGILWMQAVQTLFGDHMHIHVHTCR